MSTYETIRRLVTDPDAPERDKLIFTPKEVMDATGITKGTLTNRAYRMGIKRKGYYTLEEVVRILTKPLKIIHSYDAQHVELLQMCLIEKLGAATRHGIEHRWPYDDEEENK